MSTFTSGKHTTCDVTHISTGICTCTFYIYISKVNGGTVLYLIQGHDILHIATYYYVMSHRDGIRKYIQHY